MGTSRYTPDGIDAMARQHPILERTDADLAHIARAKAKAERKAKQREALASEPAPTGSAGKDFGGAEERRLRKRARDIYNG